MKKIIRITTVPVSLGGLLKGQLRFMSQYYQIIGISSAAGDTLQKVGEKEGIPVQEVAMTRKITPFKDLIAVYKLYCVFRSEKPFIVHSHTPKAGTLSMIAAYLARVPHRLHTIAGLPLLEATGSKRKILDIVEKITYRFATKIYPNSFGLQQIILSNKFTTPNKLKVIAKGSSNGIDCSYFDPNRYQEDAKHNLRVKLGIATNDLVFVFLGRLVTDKGINELVAAFMNLQRETSQVKLLLVGTYEKELDPLDSQTENEIDQNPDIIAVGWQNDVRPYYAISNLLVFPSYREGFPNVVLQAGAMGIPSIVSNINGCNEIVTQNINGLIVPPKDSEALYQAMKKLNNDRLLLAKLGTQSRSKIVSNYKRETVWHALLEEYKILEKNTTK